ncbi:MAG: tetratricopeptide repeat protein [Leptospiraceae bacterium]|nr:tetratricopeptide repeat protein [Leptospiraceae bacterium]
MIFKLVTVLFFLIPTLLFSNSPRPRWYINHFEYYGEENEAWLSEGFRETLIHNLNRLKNIEIVKQDEEAYVKKMLEEKRNANDSIDRFKTLPSILKVDYIYDAILKNDGKVLIFTIHIRKSPDYSIYKKLHVDGRKDNILDIQDQLIANVVNNLNIKYDSDEKKSISKGHIYFYSSFKKFSKGLISMYNKKYSEAIQTWEELKKEDSSYTELYELLAYAYRKQKDYKKALYYCEEYKNGLEKRNNKKSWAYVSNLDRIAELQLLLRNYKDAERTVKFSLMQQRDYAFEDSLQFSNSNELMASVFEKQKKNDEALSFYELSNTLRAKIDYKDSYLYSDTLIQIADVLSKKGRFDPAIKTYEEAVEHRKKNEIYHTFNTARAYNHSGLVYNKKKDYDTSIEMFQNSNMILDKIGKQKVNLYASNLNDIGVSLMNKADYENAIFYFKKGLALREELKQQRTLAYAVAAYNLGDIYYRKMSEPCESMPWLGKAAGIESSLNHPYARQDLEYYTKVRKDCEALKTAIK